MTKQRPPESIKETYASIQLLARRIREENESPDDITGSEIRMLAYGLHDDLRAFVSLRAAEGGYREVSLRPYIDLLLEVFTSFKWSIHVR